MVAAVLTSDRIRHSDESPFENTGTVTKSEFRTFILDSQFFYSKTRINRNDAVFPTTTVHTCCVLVTCSNTTVYSSDEIQYESFFQCAIKNEIFKQSHTSSRDVQVPVSSSMLLRMRLQTIGMNVTEDEIFKLQYHMHPHV